jgi:hypothetical protein
MPPQGCDFTGIVSARGPIGIQKIGGSSKNMEASALGHSNKVNKALIFLGYSKA